MIANLDLIKRKQAEIERLKKNIDLIFLQQIKN